MEKKELENLLVSCLEFRLSLMSRLEKVFAKGIIDFYKNHKYLSEKQISSARKLVVRLITEKDAGFFFSA